MKRIHLRPNFSQGALEVVQETSMTKKNHKTTRKGESKASNCCAGFQPLVLDTLLLLGTLGMFEGDVPFPKGGIS